MKTRDEALRVWADLCSQVAKDHPWYTTSQGPLGKVEKSWTPGYLFGGVQLKGNNLGRVWETVANVFYRKTWGLDGELLTQTYFRGAPPGRERERELPFFYLGPRPMMISSRVALGELPYQILRQFDKPGSADSAWIARDSEPRRVLGKASYPRMQDLLHSSKWLAAYDQWSSISDKSRSRPPFVAGLGHRVQFSLALNELQSAEEFSRTLGLFFDLVETIEPGFDAPRPAEQPFSKMGGDMDGVPIERQLFMCPKCGKLETTDTVFDRFGRVVNYKTKDCGCPLFADEKH
jgi:hypothetical protein